MFKLSRILVLATFIVSSVIANTKLVNAECIGVGAGLAYNTTTKETSPIIKGGCQVVTNVYVEPSIKFSKAETVYGLGLNYRFVNTTPLTPTIGVGLETGDSFRGFGQIGAKYKLNYPVLLDVNLKVPFNRAHSSEVTMGGSYQF